MTERERQLLSAIMDRILPTGSDAGAKDANAIAYAEWYFRQPTSRSLWDACAIVLRFVDEFAGAVLGKPFLQCDADEQDTILDGAQKVPHPAVQQFFVTVIRVTLAGFLCAPRYGGNRDHSGWNMIGFTPHPITLAGSLREPQ